MYKGILSGLLIVLLSMLYACSTGSHLEMETPQEGQSVVIGAVLVENNGINDNYMPVRSGITVVITGNTDEGVEGYRVKTNSDGYFILQNVPPGKYILKGIEVDVGFGNIVYVTSAIRADGVHYVRARQDRVLYTVQNWPDFLPEGERLVNMDINYFLLDRSGRVVHHTHKTLQNSSLNLSGESYTMDNPELYFSQKYPESQWFD